MGPCLHLHIHIKLILLLFLDGIHQQSIDLRRKLRYLIDLFKEVLLHLTLQLSYFLRVVDVLGEDFEQNRLVLQLEHLLEYLGVRQEGIDHCQVAFLHIGEGRVELAENRLQCFPQNLIAHLLLLALREEPLQKLHHLLLRKVLIFVFLETHFLGSKQDL